MTSRFTQSLCLEDLCDWLASSTPSERHYIHFVSFFPGGKITQPLAFELCRECRIAVEKVDRWLSVAAMDKDLTISVFPSQQLTFWTRDQHDRSGFKEFKSRGPGKLRIRLDSLLVRRQRGVTENMARTQAVTVRCLLSFSLWSSLIKQGYYLEYPLPLPTPNKMWGMCWDCRRKWSSNSSHEEGLFSGSFLVPSENRWAGEEKPEALLSWSFCSEKGSTNTIFRSNSEESSL